MTNLGSFAAHEEWEHLMHDLQDIDYLLAQIPPKETKTQ